jgi:hypothetical protein
MKHKEIKAALLMHGEDLTDYLTTFQVSVYSACSFTTQGCPDVFFKICASIRNTIFTDRMETSVFRGPSMLMKRRGDRVRYSTPSARLRALLQSPSGQAAFERITVVVQGCWEEAGLRGASTSGSMYLSFFDSKG